MAGQGEQPSANNDATGTGEGQQSQQQQPQVKFLGKYSSLDEAERGHKELERFAYEQSRRAAELSKQLEQLASNPQIPGASYGYAPQGSVPGYGSFIDPRQEAELQTFYTNPLEYLKRRDAEVEKRAADQVRREFRAELQSRDVLAQWKSENPDLVRHEPLVATFVAQQSAHLPVRERLDRAAEEARRYLANEIARNGQRGQAPNPNQVVESPANGGVPGAQYVSPTQEQLPTEDALAEYVKERNAFKEKRMLR
jgi:hypothetical protein